jgi:hypothetical protein
MMKTARDGGVSQKYAIGESSVRIDCPSANWLLLLLNARRKETQLNGQARRTTRPKAASPDSRDASWLPHASTARLKR